MTELPFGTVQFWIAMLVGAVAAFVVNWRASLAAERKALGSAKTARYRLLQIVRADRENVPAWRWVLKRNWRLVQISWGMMNSYGKSVGELPKAPMPDPRPRYRWEVRE